MERRMPVFYSAVMLTAVNLLLKLASTLFSAYLSGQIGAAGVGLMQLVLSVGGLSLTVSIAGIRTCTMYLCAEELGTGKPHNIGWVLGGCLRYSLVFSLAVALSLYGLAPMIASGWIGNPHTVSALRVLAVFLPVSCLCGVMTGYFTAAGRIGTLAVVEIAEQIISMGSAMTFLAMGAKSQPGTACTAVVLGSALGSCVTLICLCFLAKIAPRRQKIPVRKRLLSIALPLAVADDLKAGLTTAENLMVPKRLALYHTAADPLATFGVICGMVFPVMMFPAAILYALAELMIPELARCNAAGHPRRIRYLTGRSLKVALLYGCFFCGILYLAAEPLCLALYHNAQAGHQLKLYALLIPMLYCDAITDAANKGLGQQKICMRYNIFTAAMDLAGLYLLLPRFGVMGYFLSFFISHAVNFYLSIGLLCRITRRKMRVKIPATATLCTGICVYLSNLLSTVLLRLGTFCILWLCLLTLTGLFKKEDRSWILSLVRQAHA